MGGALRARLGAAFDRACAPPSAPVHHEEDTQGGFFPEAGGFLPDDGGFLPEAGGFVADKPPSGRASSPALELDRLPLLLVNLGVDGELHEEVSALLRSQAEPTQSGPVLRRAPFLQVLEAVLNEEEMASPESEAPSDASDTFEPAQASDSDDSDSAPTSRSTRSHMPRSKALHKKARILYGLLLERIPLVPSASLAERAKSTTVRTDVEEEEIDTRRIGVAELRYAAQSLGETPTTAEVRCATHPACRDARRGRRLFPRYARHCSPVERAADRPARVGGATNADLPT